MNVLIWSEVKSGLDIAHIEISNFTSDEQTQATEFGPLVINLGGIYQKSVQGVGSPTPPAVDVNFSLEPIKVVVDPSSSAAPVKYDRTFPVSAEFVVPGACANAFCTEAQTKIVAAYNTWKNQTTAYVVNLSQTLS
jgi:hypothetical protein